MLVHFFKFLDSLGFNSCQAEITERCFVYLWIARCSSSQSWKGTLGSYVGSDAPGDLSPHRPFGRLNHERLFFDAYSTSIGKKSVTIRADRMERFLVCEFGGHDKRSG
jgi:hypothetical protein